MSRGAIEHLPARYDDIAKAVGCIVLYWSEIEPMLETIITKLSEVVDPAYTEQGVQGALDVSVSVTDLKQKVVTLKGLAFLAFNRDMPEKFQHIESLLDFVGGRLLIERNRYIQNEWVDDADVLVRAARSSRLTRPEVGQPQLRTWQEDPFEDVEAVFNFVEILHWTLDDLEALRAHLSELVLVRDQKLDRLTPLPEAWSSIARQTEVEEESRAEASSPTQV